jgi:hypothetical protein
MKCSNPDCNRCIGLVHYRRWFSKRRYCSRQCRDEAVPRAPTVLQEQRNTNTYFEWLFLQPIEPKPIPAVSRRVTRHGFVASHRT